MTILNIAFIIMVAVLLVYIFRPTIGDNGFGDDR